MLTVDELRGIPLFDHLAEDELVHLTRAAADMHLQTGEYAVNEGEGRALFVVLDGRVEATKRVEGIERTVGVRVPGNIFGEVPLVLGTPFPASFRAAEPSRVMRIDARTFGGCRTRDLGEGRRVGARPHRRLEALAAEDDEPQVRVIGDRWDAVCHDVRRFLARNQITFEWESPEDGRAPGSLPALTFPDGEVLVRPDARTLAERLGLSTCPSESAYDTIIIGGGPAGLAAAVYGASEGLRTVMIEREAPGGQAGTSSRIENYLGFPTGVSGDELTVRALQQAKRLGAEVVVTRTVSRLDPIGKVVELDGGDVLTGRTFILATGVSWRRLSIDGFERLVGKGVYYGAARSEASSTQGLDVYLIGAGNSAGQAALYFSTTRAA